MGDILYNIFIMPLEMIFQVLFSFVRVKPVYGIFLVSIVMNFLALPLYMRADAIQEEERDKVKSMSKWVEHIKKTFKGDERYMMLTRFYKQENYKPIYALRSTFSLLLQIPFFIAAYNFLSNVSSLNAQSFLFINDLGAPDALIKIGGFSLNILPILMTAINLVSGYIYLRGFPLKDKLQTYGIAIVFLVLLYNKPSGLVLYWTLNQIFSVMKNVFMKLIKTRKAKNIVFSLVGVMMGIIMALLRGFSESRHILIFFGVLLIPQIPMLSSLIKAKMPKKENFKSIPTGIFILSELFITLLVGAVIPLSVISTEPASFAFGNNTPLTIIINNLSLATGFFMVWIGVFYYLSEKKIRNGFTVASVILSAVFILDFMCFNKNFGNLSIELIYDKIVQFTFNEQLINAFGIIVAAIIIIFIIKSFRKITKYALSISIVGLVALITVNGIHTNQVLIEARARGNETENGKVLNLSKNGKNVLVIFLDRAMNCYVPFMMEERPELKEQFDGFTYYRNVLSFGVATNFASPAIYGGYEYRPDDINKRENELLEDKHNEALKVLPTIFANNNYKAVLTDPPYAGYSIPPDLSVFEKDNFEAYNLSTHNDDETVAKFDKLQLRNFFMYSIYQIAPNTLKAKIYDSGDYMSYDIPLVNKYFLDSFNKLSAIKNIINIKDDNSNNFIYVANESPHYVDILATPDYSLRGVDREKEISQGKRVFDLSNSKKLKISDEKQIAHYHVNMASFIEVGKLFEYMKKNGVYDNTRIILVSDHAFELDNNELLMFDKLNAEAFCALLMVKDFNATGFNVSDEFMTNADVPTLATEGIIENPTNPFTGNPIDSGQKSEKQLVTTSMISNPWDNNGNVFDTSDGEWWYVDKNIFDENNWQLAK